MQEKPTPFSKVIRLSDIIKKKSKNYFRKLYSKYFFVFSLLPVLFISGYPQLEMPDIQVVLRKLSDDSLTA